MWAVLGIDSSADVKQVRRAYAARLKTIDADGDPVAFQQLRKAYEWALQALANQARPEQPQPDLGRPVLQPQTAPPEAVSAAPVPPEDQELVDARHAIVAAVKAGDSRTAMRALIAGLGKGAVVLGERDQAIEFVMQVVIRDGGLAPEEYLAMLHDVGWDVAPNFYEPMTQTREAARVRADAERWYQELAMASQGKEKISGSVLVMSSREKFSDVRRAAEIMLKGGSVHFQSERVSNILRTQLDTLKRHEKWVGHHFDAAHIEKIDKAWRWRINGSLLGNIALTIGAVLVVLAIVIGAVEGGNGGFALFAIPLVRWVWIRWSTR